MHCMEKQCIVDFCAHELMDRMLCAAREPLRFACVEFFLTFFLHIEMSIYGRRKDNNQIGCYLASRLLNKIATNRQDSNQSSR